MKHNIEKLFILSFFLLSILNHAQEFGKGALLDFDKFNSSIKSPPLSRGDFKKLPKKYSLKKYAPVPGNQGSTATCTGWAISYSARSILEAILTESDSTFKTFSPSYIYNQIRPKEGCEYGTSLIDGLDLIKNDGVLPFEEFGYDCEKNVQENDKKKANKYRIKEYRQIFHRETKNKILNVKKSISEKRPVVIGMNCPNSFYNINEVWIPTVDEYTKNFNGHAITVIGYDDQKESGSFEIMNSWGTNWGNEGFAWIKYNDFEHFCVWGGELIPFKSKKELNKIEAEIMLVKLDSSIIPINKGLNNYFVGDTFYTGDMFQLKINNKSPAYLYIMGVDKEHTPELIYPMDSLTSDYLAYSENTIILPSENYAFEFDINTGISSLVIIFSTIKQNNILLNDGKLNLDKYKANIEKLETAKLSDATVGDNNLLKLSESSTKEIISIIKIDFNHFDRR